MKAISTKIPSILLTAALILGIPISAHGNDEVRDYKHMAAEDLAICESPEFKRAAMECDYVELIGYNNKMLAKYPKISGLWMDRGCNFGRCGEYSKAISDLTKAIELDPNESNYYYRAYWYEYSGNLQLAKKDFEQAIKLATNAESKSNMKLMIKLMDTSGGRRDRISMQKKAEAYGKANQKRLQEVEAKCDPSLLSFSASTTLKPERFSAEDKDYAIRSSTSYAVQELNKYLNNKRADHEKLLDSVKTGNVQSLEIMFDSLLHNHSLEKIDETILICGAAPAQAKLVSLLKEAKDHAEKMQTFDYLTVAEEASKFQKWRLAIEAISIAERRFSLPPVFLRLKAECLMELGELQKSKDITDKLPPGDESTSLLRAKIAIRAGDYRTALASLGEHPKSASAISLRALCLSLSGEFDRAKSEISKATEERAASRNRDIDGQLNIAIARAICGQSTKSLSDLSELIGLAKSSKLNGFAAKALIWRASVLVKLNDSDSAKEDLKEAVAIKPSGYQIQEDYAEALRLLKIKAGEQAFESVALSRPWSSKWALCVGVSKFKDGQINLKYSSKDASDFASFLVSKCGFPADHVKLLKDDQASKASLLDSIGGNWLPNNAGPDDLVVLYVSTHGSPPGKDSGGLSYLVCYDTDKTKLYATGIPLQELSRMLRTRLRTDRALIILDTCYSGVVAGKENSEGSLAEEVSLATGHLVLTSCKDHQRSWESKRYENGVFTKKLIDVLASADQSTEFKQSLYPILKKDVLAETEVDFHAAQEPQITGLWSGKGAFSASH